MNEHQLTAPSLAAFLFLALWQQMEATPPSTQHLRDWAAVLGPALGVFSGIGVLWLRSRQARIRELAESANIKINETQAVLEDRRYSDTAKTQRIADLESRNERLTAENVALKIMLVQAGVPIPPFDNKP